MENILIDKQQRNAAKVAGFAYLFTFGIVVFANYGIYDQLNVPGNATETAKNIVAHKHLFRFGIVLDLMYAIGFTVLLSSLYTILKDINSRLVIIAAVWQLIYVIVWVTLTLKFFDALRLISGGNSLKVFTEEQLHSLSKLFLNARFDRYYGVLMFYSLGSAFFNYLWFKSGYIPRAFAMCGIIACVWCAIFTIAYLIYPELENIINIWIYDTPMAIFDITLSIWLLLKGLGEQKELLPTAGLQ